MPEWLTGPMLFGLLAGLFALGSAVWSGIDETRDAKEQSRHIEEEKRLLEELQEKDEQIIAIQSEALAHATGGDSIFYLSFVKGEDGGFEAHYKIHGKYPIPNVFLNVTNIELLARLREENVPAPEVLRKAIRDHPIGTYWPGTPLGFRRFPFSETGHGLYRILIIQPKGVYLQYAAIVKNEDVDDIIAFRTYRMMPIEEGKPRILQRLAEPRQDDSRLSQQALRFIEHPETWDGEFVIVP